jgi:hypothetical protein
VYYHLKGMELPSEVIGLLRHENLALSLAMTAWKKTKENPAETAKILRDAVETSKASGARKVMPKHVAGLGVISDNTDTSVVETGDTTVDTSVSTGGVVDTNVADIDIDTGVATVLPADATEAAIAKATALVLAVLKDARWIAGDDGFVSLDPLASDNAEWPVEEFLFFAKALGFRIPAVLELLEGDNTTVVE